MRLREVKVGMKVKVYRNFFVDKYFVGEKGKVEEICLTNTSFPIEVRLTGENYTVMFSHKELKEIKYRRRSK